MKLWSKTVRLIDGWIFRLDLETTLGFGSIENSGKRKGKLVRWNRYLI